MDRRPPWAVAAVLGTAVSFIVGFRNLQTYNRTLEALQVWGAIAGTSRYWGLISRDFPTSPDAAKPLIYRHFAWLTALRYRLRGSGSSKAWESAASRSNKEYRAKNFSVPETESPLSAELQKYLPEADLKLVEATESKTSRLLSLQSEAIRDLQSRQVLSELHRFEMQQTIKSLLEHQGRLDRIKNFPYPRQYAAINTLFVWCFIVMLPFCLVREFDRLNDGVTGLLQGHTVWLAVPFSLLISWIYAALDQVGESTENPFEGGANDVPMAQLSRNIEIDLREMLGESDLPPRLQPKNEIIL